MALPINPSHPSQEILRPASQGYGKAISDSSTANVRRRFPIGAEVLSDGDVYFRVWTPRSREVEVIIDGPAKDLAVIRLNAEPDGYFSVRTARAKAGDLYRYCLDGGASALPDPASRFQPQ